MSWNRVSRRSKSSFGRRAAGLLLIAGLIGGGWWGYGRFGAGAHVQARGLAGASASGTQAPLAVSIVGEVKRASEVEPLFGRVPGGEAMAKGDFRAAAEQLERHLSNPEADYADEARFHLATCYRERGDEDKAVAVFKDILELHPRSSYCGGALLGLAEAAKADGKIDEHDKLLFTALTKYSRTRGGAASALRLADRWHEKFVVEQQVKAHWEEIRDAYSVAVSGLDNGPRREEVIKRLNRLNDYLLFGKGVKSGGVAIYRVQPGDVLSKIRRKFGVSVGSIMRMNGLKSAHRIRVGQQLKILRGATRIHVDRKNLRLTLHVGDVFLKEYPIGIGPDNATPVGTFKIATMVKDPTWYPSAGREIPPGNPQNILGSRWMGFERTGDGVGIGIHGTTKPESVPGRESAGCIRMLNENVEEIFDWVQRGTVVTVGQ